jgi:hypothetical protein
MKVPEQVLMGFRGIVATSDTAIIDESEKYLIWFASSQQKRQTPLLCSGNKLNAPNFLTPFRSCKWALQYPNTK